MPDRGFRVLLSLKDFKAHLVPSAGEHVKVPGLGVLDPGSLKDAKPGDVVHFCGEPYVFIAGASLSDSLGAVERRAQIITLKDAGPIVARLGIGPGTKVVEVGAGSGYLTMALAHFVGEAGRVTAHDIEPRSIELVRKNLGRAGLEGRVDFVEGDSARAQGDGSADAFVADVPNPWDMLEFAESSLRPGGWGAFYAPSANQTERVVRALRGRGWACDLTIETLERQMVVGEHGIRPAFEMLGHTGYLTFARWLGRDAGARLTHSTYK
jgi:tRNA (adenine57-N1/adenine58-N1)-methyltransferase